jgi:hypothetical protein
MDLDHNYVDCRVFGVRRVQLAVCVLGMLATDVIVKNAM